MYLVTIVQGYPAETELLGSRSIENCERGVIKDICEEITGVRPSIEDEDANEHGVVIEWNGGCIATVVEVKQPLTPEQNT